MAITYQPTRREVPRRIYSVLKRLTHDVGSGRLYSLYSTLTSMHALLYIYIPRLHFFAYRVVDSHAITPLGRG